MFVSQGLLFLRLVFNLYVAEHDLEFLIHLLLPSKFRDYKFVPPCLAYLEMGFESRAS